MLKQTVVFMIALSLFAIATTTAGASDWAVKADMAESCSCNPACPCTFGSPPTLGHCDAVQLYEIKSGHYGDVSLDGISMVVTTRFMEWIKFSVSEDATDEQVKAAEQLVSALYGFPASVKVLSSERAPVSVERTETTVKFSIPTSTVEIEMMKGADGKPIKIQNLPAQGAPGPKVIDHTQYKSITLDHQSEDKKFRYSHTNGFTGRLEASGEI
ncbi:MAG: DUF1326 domain-containing protein [Candidatus Glassbacteria bacterium]